MNEIPTVCGPPFHRLLAILKASQPLCDTSTRGHITHTHTHTHTHPHTHPNPSTSHTHTHTPTHTHTHTPPLPHTTHTHTHTHTNTHRFSINASVCKRLNSRQGALVLCYGQWLLGCLVGWLVVES